jgi:hypothetical protein
MAIASGTFDPTMPGRARAKTIRCKKEIENG